jgi:cholesterol transport system auxiliary component
VVATLALGMVLAGCLSRPALVRQTFAFQNPPPSDHAAAGGQGILAVRTIEVSPLFDRQAFVYRTGPDSYEVDPYASFLIPPDRALAIPIRRWLRDSGAFEDVIEPGSLIRADQVLQVFVSELYGDFRQPDHPAAVLSLRLLLLRSGAGGKVLLRKDYSRSVPLKQKTAAAVMAGWNQALSEIMGQAATDLAATVETP